MPLLTRLYSPSDFAALNLFTQFVAGLAILITLRFEYLVMLPADQNESHRVLGLVFRLGAIHVFFLTPLLVVLPGYWPWLQAQGSMVGWLWLAPVTAWVLSLAVGLQQVVQRKGNFRTSATAEFIGRCAYVACTLGGALALPNIIGLILATLVNASGKIIWLVQDIQTLSPGFWKFKEQPISNAIKKMAFSTSASNLISLITGFAPLIYIADRYGTGALGQYGLVISTLYLPSTLIGQAIGQVYYQRACQLHNDGKNFKSLLVNTALNLSKIGIPLYACISVISPFAYPLIFGESWLIAGELAPWLCIAAATSFITTPLDRTSIIVNAWWYTISWHLIRALSTCALLLWMSSNSTGIQGFVAALAVLSAAMYSIDYFASYLFAKK
ncbi:hypothetical protein B9Z49_09755 [Limnohabitans sp. 2KL-51]|nr:hypothetical protein B9Z49_09755 [Limnohabitans sp. 2KL-51]